MSDPKPVSAICLECGEWRYQCVCLEICAGCAVKPPWEHRCIGGDYCACQECKPPPDVDLEKFKRENGL